MADASLSLLHSLAGLYDIQTSYYDVNRRRQRTSPEGLLALLRALGAPVARTEDIPLALRERRAQLWQQPLEPVAVAWDGGPPVLTIRLPAREAEQAIACRLHLENGESESWTFKPSALRLTKKERVGGVSYVAARIPISRFVAGSLPLGYHRLVFAFGHAAQEVLLVSAPVQAYCAARSEAKTAWGVFLPLYALSTTHSWGAGDFGDLEVLMDWVCRLGGQFVATLPLLATFLNNPYDPSPYAPVSRLFWNEFYVNIERIPELRRCREAQAFLHSPAHQSDIAALRAAPLVDYRRQMAAKRRVMEQLAKLLVREPSGRRDEFWAFVKGSPWAEDYARFRATCEKVQRPWQEWPQRLQDGILRDDDYSEHDKVYHLYAQWLASQQMETLSEHAARTGEGLYLDLPLGVHAFGYDVWREKGSFVLGCSGGAPPDAFFTGGQDWGFPPLHPQGIRQQGYRYIIAYLRHHMKHARVLRIDHVMGLHRLFMIPKGLEATEGAYVRYQAEELYAILGLESHRYQTRLVGENLGTVPSYVNAALARHRIHPMYVLQYELRPPPKPVLGPVRRGAVAALNTHDMPSFAAFWKALDVQARLGLGLQTQDGARAERRLRKTYRRRLGSLLRKSQVLRTRLPHTYQLLEACLAFLGGSQAALVVVNLEDLWLETEPQNVPGTEDPRLNWVRKSRHRFEAFWQSRRALKTLRILDCCRKAWTQTKRRGSRLKR